MSLLREILRNESSLPKEYRHDWIFWLDYDTIIRKLDYQIDFDRYKDYDTVMWGIPFFVDVVPDGMGINNGVILLRNSNWSLRYMELLCEFGLNNGRAREPDMRKHMYNYNLALYEQNAMVYLFNTMPEIRKRMFFERLDRLNWFWKIIPVFNQPFVVHFAGCQFCWFDSNPRCMKHWKYHLRKSNQTYYNLNPSKILL